MKSKITGEAKLEPGYCSENPSFYHGVGGGGALEGSFGAVVPLSPSNAEPVEDKMILSVRFPVFVTQSPTQLFPLW